MTAVNDRLVAGRTVFSVEFFPPHDAAQERRLWRSIHELEPLDPAYVSVTSRAGGSARDRTARTTARIARDTTLLPVAHLSAVDHSTAELRHLVGAHASDGIGNFLAVRGDPPTGPSGEWTPHPSGVQHAAELVRLVREFGDFSVGVAAFPYMHPRSPDVETDTAHLVNKIRTGADFAVSQLFLEPDYYLRLRDRMALRGCHVPLLAGVMPITSPRLLDKYVELTGVRAPQHVVDLLEPLRDEPTAFREAGISLITRMCERLMREDVPALHFHSFNRSAATREIVQNLGLARTGEPAPTG